jgi:hypothetical protein
MVICCCDFLGCISQGAGWSSCAVLKAPYMPFVIVRGQRPVHILLPTYPLRCVSPPDTITYILANPPDTLIYIPTALRKPTRY